MSKALSLKLREDVFEQVEQITRRVHIPRNTYINRALHFYNAYNRRKLLKRQLLKESRMVRDESLIVLHEFENLQDDLISCK
jgi:predicted transcriptional regulator